MNVDAGMHVDGAQVPIIDDEVASESPRKRATLSTVPSSDTVCSTPGDMVSLGAASSASDGSDACLYREDVDVGQ
jgi:hypothetical protein